ncbi:DNAation factor subunit beta [Plakobranchus ocellatus]|uniref:DNAation factor subunit beta n=1 Tax=Plakobranchus ocellatus TaxID=259542 RepID=A0AAV4CW78_9GAST|nr:DNAation factor subunit beta [Plakobranchus ocellatus]
MRPYKVRNSKQRSSLQGIVASNLKELISRGKKRLQIPEDQKVRVVLEVDGTQVQDDDYLGFLSEQQVLVLLRDGEIWSGMADLFYQMMVQLADAEQRAEQANQIEDLLTSDDLAPEKILLLTQYLQLLKTNIDAERRSEDKEWFEGVDKKFKTKTEVMRNSAQQRIRSYFYSAKEQMEKEKDKALKADLTIWLNELNKLVTKHTDQQGNLFDRYSTCKTCMCDNNGWFACKGAYDKDECSNKHVINPYASRGYKLMFQLWNLDHYIEKSREVVPKFIEAVKNLKNSPNGRKLNLRELYNLLCTHKNLNLVYIDCHAKGARPELRIKPDRFYM